MPLYLADNGQAVDLRSCGGAEILYFVLSFLFVH